jgi:hypothetical protein
MERANRRGWDSKDPDGAVRCYEMLARWRQQGELEDLIIE